VSRYRVIKNKSRFLFSIILFILLIYIWISISSCVHKTPSTPDDICTIFDDKWRWHKHAKKSQNKWGTPIHVQMAILKQESGFRYDAKPGRKKLLGLIPWKRKSSAYGYAQALNATWKEYIKATGNSGADRDKFKDAIDFVGWYTSKSHRKAKISKWDAYSQYLAYHEGQAGYLKKSYNKKKWLLKVAQKVDSQSKKYAQQIKSCQ